MFIFVPTQHLHMSTGWCHIGLSISEEQQRREPPCTAPSAQGIHTRFQSIPEVCTTIGLERSQLTKSISFASLVHRSQLENSGSGGGKGYEGEAIVAAQRVDHGFDRMLHNVQEGETMRFLVAFSAHGGLMPHAA